MGFVEHLTRLGTKADFPIFIQKLHQEVKIGNPVIKLRFLVKKIILHIGMSKTGSTSIQKFLKSNAKNQSIPSGFYYSQDLGQNIISSVLKNEKNPFKPYRDFKGVLLASHEAISSKIRTDSKLSRLKSMIFDEFDEVLIISYLRRQDELLISSYYTFLIHGGIKTLSEYLLNDPIDYSYNLEKWKSEFGKSNLSLRIFGDSYFENGDLIEDFCGACGLDYTEMQRSPSANVSPCLELLEFIRLIGIALKGSSRRQRIMKLIGNIPIRGTKIGIPRSRRIQIISDYEEVNRKISREFFQRDILFSHEIRDDFIEDPIIDGRDIKNYMDAFSDHYKIDRFFLNENGKLDSIIINAAEIFERVSDEIT